MRKKTNLISKLAILILLTFLAAGPAALAESTHVDDGDAADFNNIQARIVGSACANCAELTLGCSDIEFFNTTVYALANDAIFRSIFEDDIAEIAEGISGIESIRVRSWGDPRIVGDRVYFNSCVIELTYVSGLSDWERVSLQSLVQSQIKPKWFVNYVQPNYIYCIPENPHCPPWPGYVIGELIVGFNNSNKEHDVIKATVHNNGEISAHDVVVQFFDGDPSTGNYHQIGTDKRIGHIEPKGSGIAQVAWNAPDEYNICVKIDPYDSIEELNEDNNQACTQAPKTIYVDDDFADDPPSHRWNTIQEGIDDAGYGDTVIVYPGVYTESINFLGKNITLTSASLMDSKTVKSTTIDGLVRFRGTEEASCRLRGFNINQSIIGYDWDIDPSGENHTHATISHCVLENITTGCGGVIQACDGTISNCLIANISYMCLRPAPVPAIVGCHALIRNCTMVNMHDGIQILEGGTCTIENCIMYRSSPLHVASGAILDISYCDIERNPPSVFGPGTVNWGPGNIDTDPCFVQLGDWQVDGDYHLKSQAGRYDAKEGRWVMGDATSPCIDAGDPMSPIGREPFPNGGIVNMGAYGGTAEASKSYFGKPPCETIVAGDVNGDCIVDFKDFALMSLHWLADNSG